MGNIPISCKCVTYGRVNFLEESIYSFINQDYDGERELIIVNDYPEQKLFFDHPDVKIFNIDKTFETIGDKENFTVNNCKYDTIAVWDDDDIALPNHLNNIDKYFPPNDLLHWVNGAFVNHSEITKLTNLGNSGIVFSKKIWEDAGGYPRKNAGHDLDFVVHLKRDLKCSVVNASPENSEVSWMYLWGGRGYHMSGQGSDDTNEENILVRHKRHIDKMKSRGEIPIGEITLTPKWMVDYKQLLKDYINEDSSGSRDA